MKYLFCTEHFGINDSGIHLLRSRYNYKSIAFSEVSSVEIRRGKAIKNWLFLMLFGIGCLAFSFYYALAIFEYFSSDEGGRIYIEEIVVPVIPAFAGVASLFVSLRNTAIAVVKYGRGNLVLDLSELAKKGEAAAFAVYLADKAGTGKMKYSTDLNPLPVVNA